MGSIQLCLSGEQMLLKSLGNSQGIISRNVNFQQILTIFQVFWGNLFFQVPLIDFCVLFNVWKSHEGDKMILGLKYLSCS